MDLGTVKVDRLLSTHTLSLRPSILLSRVVENILQLACIRIGLELHFDSLLLLRRGFGRLAVVSFLRQVHRRYTRETLPRQLASK